MDCELLTVGTELVLGHTVDTNAAELGRALAAAGVAVRRHTSVGDEAALVAGAVREALGRTGVLIVTGGLGPTTDDLTKRAVAEALGRRLVRVPELLEKLRDLYRRRGLPEMPESNASQADVPEGASVLPNPIGTAPGLWLEDAPDRLVVLLPGVPQEMRTLLEGEVLPRLEKRAGAAAPGHARTVVRSRTLRTTGLSESALADKLREYEKLLGPALTLASLPSPEGTDLRLTAWRLGEQEAEAALSRALERLAPLVGPHAYGQDGDDLAAVVLRSLEERGARLAVAESCTGGLVGARLTAVRGSSRVFAGGVVAYDNEVKLGMLGVSADVLAEHGAVSEAAARAMAEGVGRALGTEAAVAVTGIAGPDGGSPEKPVGTVWIAVRWNDSVRAFSHLFPGGRAEVRARAAQAALNYVRRVVAGTV